MVDTRLMVPEPGIVITPAQRLALRWLREDLIRHAAHSSRGEIDPGYEFKTWQVTELGARGIIVLLSTIGMVDDEGTLAYLTRDHRQIAIGPKGATWLMNAKGKDGGIIFGKRQMPKGRAVVWHPTVY